MLGNSYCSRSACPIEHVLEQVMMDCAKVCKIQIAVRKRFGCPRVGYFGFEIVELALVAQIELINEDRGIS